MDLKSGANWLKGGDRNTSSFHGFVTGRKKEEFRKEIEG
jgi:hypothetical protein